MPCISRVLLQVECHTSRSPRPGESNTPVGCWSRAAGTLAGGLQTRSRVFAVADDFEEHTAQDLYLVLAEAAQDCCLDAGAGAGRFLAKGFSCGGDFRNSRATVARVAAAHDKALALEPVQLTHEGRLVQTERLSQFALGEVPGHVEGAAKEWTCTCETVCGYMRRILSDHRTDSI